VKKSDVVRVVLGEHWQAPPANSSGEGFAPTNIALCKYWGKRNQELNLPLTSSFSISLGNKGASVTLALIENNVDEIILNDKIVDPLSSFSKRLIDFLDLFRSTNSNADANANANVNARANANTNACANTNTNTMPLRIRISSNIPIAAGLASSACGFASIVFALDALFGWKLPRKDLSILARLGSGSASRSIWPGFVEWHAGIREDGMDSHGESFSEEWPELCIGLLIVNNQEKSVSSREAMQRTVTTSSLFSAWPGKVNQDMKTIKQAIYERDFATLGKAAESNATAMHATMLSAWPPITYAVPETLLGMQEIWKLRQQGLPLFFTQDAGPNLKLLFLQQDQNAVISHFPNIEIVHPFAPSL